MIVLHLNILVFQNMINKSTVREIETQHLYRRFQTKFCENIF